MVFKSAFTSFMFCVCVYMCLFLYTYDIDGSCEDIVAVRAVAAAFCDLETVAMFAVFAAVAEIN